MSKTYHFVACSDDGIPVAICLEHDLVTQALSMDQIQQECADLIMCTREIDREEGLSIDTRPPPPEDAIASFRSGNEAHEFTVTIEDEP